MIGVGVQVVVFWGVLVLVLAAVGFTVGASWQWNRTGGLEDARLTAAAAHVQLAALQAQNAVLVARNAQLAARSRRGTVVRHARTNPPTRTAAPARPPGRARPTVRKDTA